ncbi:MAG TPA: hypothetical protein PLQ00_10835, partial [Thermoguttaceae bacterium]|nr:hypothetical protein [Thermoguttaceae bacterium]
MPANARATNPPYVWGQPPGEILPPILPPTRPLIHRGNFLYKMLDRKKKESILTLWKTFQLRGIFLGKVFWGKTSFSTGDVIRARTSLLYILPTSWVTRWECSGVFSSGLFLQKGQTMRNREALEEAVYA